MYLEYNGVKLLLMGLDLCERINVYTPDGTDLIGVKWRIGATCILGAGGLPAGTTAASLTAPVAAELDGVLTQPSTLPLLGANPTTRPFVQGPSGGGLNAVQTDVEARYRLMMPRRTLRLWTYDSQGNEIVWLESPRYGQPCDTQNGPKPLSCDVAQATGEAGSIGLYFLIETVTPPCAFGSDQAVLAHRWEMHHGYSETNHLTRTVTGMVILNTGKLAAIRFEADILRKQFFHPIPLGFRRHIDDVSLSADGVTLSYQYTDTDTEIVFDPGSSGAMHIDIQESMGYRTPWRIL